MTKNAKRIGVIAAMLLAVWACRDETPAPKATVEKQTEPKPEVIPQPLMLHRWTENDRAAFRVLLSSVLKDQAGQSLLELTLNSGLRVSARAVKDNTAELLVQLADPQVSLKSPDAAKTDDRIDGLQAELGQSVLGRFKNGVLVSMDLPKGSSAFAVGMWRTVLSGLQIADAQGGAAPFEATEFDGNGEYTVRYEQDSGGPWLKKKLAYTRGLYEDNADAGFGESSPKPQLLTATGEVVLDGGKIARVALQDTVKVALVGSGAMISLTVLELTRDDAANAAEIAALSPTVVTLKADEPWRMPLDIGAMDGARMEGLTFDSVLKALVAKSRDPRRKALWAKKNDEAADAAQVKDAEAWTEDWSRYFAALPAFFRQKPETLVRAEKEIRAGSPATTSLIGGMSSSGSPAAQAILLKLALDKKLEEPLREAAIRNLVQCRLPTVDTSNAVRAMEDDEFLQRYAVYGTGIISRKLKENGQIDEALDSVNWLLSLLENETEKDRRRDILRGIANAGNPAVFEKMEALLASTEPADRAGAIEAIRMIDDPRVDALIAKHLNVATEPARAVRESAVQAASVRPVENPVRQAVIDTATSDPEKRVKMLALKLLKQWADKDPSLKSVAEQIEKTAEK